MGRAPAHVGGGGLRAVHWLGAVVATAAGGLILRTFGDAYLPRNGEDLGWTRPELSVVIPPDAWGALRPLAANLAVLAIAAAIAVLAVGVARWVVGAARARESVRPGKPATTGPPH